MHSQNKPSSGTVGTIFCGGLVSKSSFPVGSKCNVFILPLGYLFLISFQHMIAFILQYQDLPLEFIKYFFSFAFCALVLSKLDLGLLSFLLPASGISFIPGTVF